MDSWCYLSLRSPWWTYRRPTTRSPRAAERSLRLEPTVVTGQGGQLYEHRWGAYGLPTTYDRVFWSRVHQQRHVTTCLMKFAVGE